MFNRASDAKIKGMQDEINAVFAKYGMAMTFGKTKVYTDRVIAQIEIIQIVPGQDANKALADRAESEKSKFIAGIPVHGLKAEDFGVRFKIGNVPYQILGYLPNRPANCISIKNLNTGKNFICSPGQIKVSMGRMTHLEMHNEKAARDPGYEDRQEAANERRAMRMEARFNRY